MMWVIKLNLMPTQKRINKNHCWRKTVKFTKANQLVQQALMGVDVAKPKLGHVLLTAQEEVDWSITNYGTWRAFCKACIGMPYTEVYKMISTMKKARKIKIHKQEALRIVESIGWTRFEMGVQRETEILTVMDFIEKYRYLNVDETPRRTKPEDDVKLFNFQLDRSTAEGLTALLLERGMRIGNSSRINASAAMAKLVADVMKES